MFLGGLFVSKQSIKHERVMNTNILDWNSIERLTVRFSAAASLAASLLLSTQASATPFFFSTGNPDGKIATLSRPTSGAKIQTETADDFVVTNCIVINQATFIGLQTGTAGG